MNTISSENVLIPKYQPKSLIPCIVNEPVDDPFPPVDAMNMPLGFVQEGLDGDYYEVEGNSNYRWWASMTDPEKSQFDHDLDAWYDTKREEEFKWEKECQACYLGCCEDPNCAGSWYNIDGGEDD